MWCRWSRRFPTARLKHCRTNHEKLFSQSRGSGKAIRLSSLSWVTLKWNCDDWAFSTNPLFFFTSGDAITVFTRINARGVYWKLSSFEGAFDWAFNTWVFIVELARPCPMSHDTCYHYLSDADMTDAVCSGCLEAYNFYNDVEINFIRCNHPLLFLRRSTKRAELFKMSAENLSYWACTNSSWRHFSVRFYSKRMSDVGDAPQNSELSALRVGREWTVGESWRSREKQKS